MSIMKDSALYLASLGFHVFPGEIVVNPKGKRVKKPMFKGWQEDATCDLELIEGVWTRVPHALPCISTSWFTNGAVWHLLVIDVDNKDGQNGSRSLGLLGFDLPATFTQRTPTGGFHLIYKTMVPTANTSKRIGPGLDTRGWAGLVVGAGSVTAIGTYTIALNESVAEAPAELVALVGSADTRESDGGERPPGINDTEATRWAIQYLSSLPVAENGTIDDRAFAAACVLRDRGLDPDQIHACMAEHFKAELPVGRLEDIAHHAYKYAKNPAGSRAPEILFGQVIKKAEPPVTSEPVVTLPADGSPIDWFNTDHTVCLVGSSAVVIRKGFDAWGKPANQFMSVDAFHHMYAGCSFQTGDGKNTPLSRAWMQSKYRSTHFGLAFAPGRPLPATHYNLWQGFAYEPRSPEDPRVTDQDRAALEYFKHRMLHSFARGDEARCHYTTSWFAQIYQDPENKEPVALVVRGEKGCGKDTIMNIVGAPLGPHYMTTSQGSDLTGQFNSALERRLMIVYNEAFWAHDKAAEGVLKTLVSERTIRIERKGCEPYFTDNLSRTVIMGNEVVQVPASVKERRWFVVDVAPVPDELQAENAERCTWLREAMEAGGYHLLVWYLLNYDTIGANLKIAPNSEGLVEQKLAGLAPVQLWFLECLQAGSIVGCGVPLDWPERIDKTVFREAFNRWAERTKVVKGREISPTAFGRQLSEMDLTIDGTQKRTEGKKQINQYVLPSLEEARKGWDKYLKPVKETKW